MFTVLAFSRLRSRIIRDPEQSGSIDREQFARLRAAERCRHCECEEWGGSALTTVAVCDQGRTVIGHDRKSACARRRKSENLRFTPQLGRRQAYHGFPAQAVLETHLRKQSAGLPSNWRGMTHSQIPKTRRVVGTNQVAATRPKPNTTTAELPSLTTISEIGSGGI